MSRYAALKEIPLQDLGAAPFSAANGFAAQFVPIGHNDTTVSYQLDKNKINADLRHIEKDKLSPTGKKPDALEQGPGTPKFSPAAARASSGASPWFNKIDAAAARLPGVRRIMANQMRLTPNMRRPNEKLTPRARAHMLREMQFNQLKKIDTVQKPIAELPVAARLMRRAERRGFDMLKNIAAKAAPAPLRAMLKPAPTRPSEKPWAGLISAPSFIYA